MMGMGSRTLRPSEQDLVFAVADLFKEARLRATIDELRRERESLDTRAAELDERAAALDRRAARLRERERRLLEIVGADDP